MMNRRPLSNLILPLGYLLIGRTGTTLAQPPSGADTCEAATSIALPFTILDGTLEGRAAGGGATNPALVCGGSFGNLEDSPETPILWYALAGTGNCACLELRSSDNAFIVGLYDDEPCDSLQCLDSTDFTSEVLIWSTTAGQKNRIAVSVLPNGPQTGLFSLEVLAVAGEKCATDGSVTRVPGSCSDMEQVDPFPISTPAPTAPAPQTVSPTAAPPKKPHKMKMRMMMMRMRSKSSKSGEMSGYHPTPKVSSKSQESQKMMTATGTKSKSSRRW